MAHRGALGQLLTIKAPSALGEWLVDVVYPKRCASCGERGRWVCDHCRQAVVLFGDEACAGCGIPHHLGRCACAELPLGIAQARAAGPFEGWLRDSILAFKYEDEWARVNDLAPYLARIITILPAIDLLVPVPLHASRLRERGYNQSALLAVAAGKLTGAPVLDGLIRTRATSQQARLDAAARAANVDGAFAVRPGSAVAGKHIVLIDDVMTTGSTLGACAAALAGAGVGSVTAATMARQL